jgi:hypothetical protein
MDIINLINIYVTIIISKINLWYLIIGFIIFSIIGIYRFNAYCNKFWKDNDYWIK